MTASRARARAGTGGSALLLALLAAMLAFVWRLQDLFPPLSAIKLVAIVGVAVPALFLLDHRAQRQLGAVLQRPLTKVLLLLVAMAALSVPVSLWPGMSFEYLTKNLGPAVAIALAVAAAITRLRDVRRIIWIQVLGAALYCAVVLVRFDIGPSGRLGDLVYYDANDLGMLLVCTIPFTAYLLRHSRGFFPRAFALFGLLLCLFTVVKSGSRGAFLGLAAVTIYLLVKFSTVRAATRLLAVAAMGVALAAGAGDRYWTSMGTLLKPTEDYNWVGKESGGRMMVWERGIGYMKMRPLTGVGLGAFPTAEGTLSPLVQERVGRGLKWSAAHNSFVQVGAELGLPGLLLFLLVLGGTFGMASRLARDALARSDPAVAGQATAHAAAVVGYAVAGFFLSQAYGPYLYFVVGTVIGLDIVARRRWRSMEKVAAALSGESAAAASGDAAPRIRDLRRVALQHAR